MPNICLVVLCGLPSSGKTTFVQEFKQFLESRANQDWAAVHVCYDVLMPSSINESIIEEQKSGLSTSAWRSYRLSILKCIENFILDLQKNSTPADESNLLLTQEKEEHCNYDTDTVENLEFLRSAFQQSISNDIRNGKHGDDTNWLIFIDDNMWLRSMRYQVCQIARKHRCSFAQVFFPISLQQALERNSKRDESRKVPDDSIHRMAARLEGPEASTYTWERFSWTWSDQNPREDERQKVLDLLLESTRSPCREAVGAEGPKEVVPTSLVHLSDVVLRREVGRRISALRGRTTKDLLSEKAKLMNDVRNAVLERLKSGIIPLPPVSEAGLEREGPMNEETNEELCRCLRVAFDEMLSEMSEPR